MKNLIFKSFILASLALFMSVSAFATTQGADQAIDKTELAAMMDIDIDMWLTSDEGCKFHIVGEVSWTGNFSGSVTASGGGDCPEGTWTFGLAAPNGGNIEVSGHPRAVSILNSNPDVVKEAALRMGLLE